MWISYGIWFSRLTVHNDQVIPKCTKHFHLFAAYRDSNHPYTTEKKVTEPFLCIIYSIICIKHVFHVRCLTMCLFLPPEKQWPNF